MTDDYYAEIATLHGQQAAKYARQRDETKVALRELIQWLDSDIVKQSIHRAGSLSRTHPHLGIEVPKEFGEWAKGVIARAREAAK